MTQEAQTPRGEVLDTQSEQPQISKNGSTHPEPGSPLKSIAEWFFLVAGVIYGTGYFVSLTYLDGFGIHESAADSLKLRYMHVGLLCIIPLAVGLALFYAFVLLSRSTAASLAEAQGTAQRRAYPAPAPGPQQAEATTDAPPPQSTASRIMGLGLFLNVLFVFYIALVFLPMGFYRQHFYPLLSLFLGTILLSMLINDYASGWRYKVGRLFLNRKALTAKEETATIQKAVRERWERWDIVLLKIVLLFAMLFVGVYWCLWGYWSHVGRVVWPGGMFYVLTFLTIIVINGMFHYKGAKHRGRDGWSGMIAARVCVLGPLCVVFALGFARGVFPWIPTGKGGANFRDVPPAFLVLDKEIQQRLPPDLCSTNGVVVLEVNTETIYVADFRSYHAWESRWQKDSLCPSARPFVWNLSRKQVLAIRYGSPEPRFSE